MPYVATINIPGYLPQDDEPPVFETAREAWEYLAEEREQGEDIPELEEGPMSDTWVALAALADPANWRGGVLDSSAGDDGTGTIYGETPGYDGDHDLGLAYSVAEISEDDYYVAINRPIGEPLPCCGRRPHVTRMTQWGFHCDTEDQGYCNFEHDCDDEEN